MCRWDAKVIPHGDGAPSRHGAHGDGLASHDGRAIYGRRKAIVEPVIGWIKHVLGFRQFSVRGEAPLVRSPCFSGTSFQQIDNRASAPRPAS